MDTFPFFPSRRPARAAFFGLVFAACAPYSHADPTVIFGADATVQGVLSSAVDPFWSQYPQYAAESIPFLRTRFGVYDEQKWRVEAEFDFQQQYTGWQSTNLPVPDPESRRDFPVEFHGMRKADLTYDFDPLILSFGRDKVHWGATQDSFIVADQVPFLDRFELRLPMGQWQLQSLIATPETRTGTETTYSITTYQVAHRLSWKQDDVEIGFTEQAILDRNIYDANGNVVQKGSYTFTDFFPFASVHEADVRPFNSMTILDVSWKLGSWRLAFESGLDDFDARIFGIPDDPIPTIPANLLEAKWTQGTWVWSASVGNTHYLWGNYYPGFGRAIYRVFLDQGVQEMPLTSPYGPGATWVNTAFQYQGRRFGFDGKFEAWAVQHGASLNSPYVGYTAGAGFDYYGRAHVYATLSDRGYRVRTGPQVLLANSSFTEQWYVEVSTTVGSSG